MVPRIRRLEPADALVAQQVVGRFHGRAISVDYLRRYLANPSNVLLVAEMGGELAGFLCAHRIDRLNREESQFFIYEIEVGEGFRRRGIGSALLGAVLEVARQEGIDAFVFTNHSNQSAVRFYQSMGGIVKNGDDLLLVYLNGGSRDQPHD
jgi:aminoglycoside 3-N-acetyltransferase I